MLILHYFPKDFLFAHGSKELGFSKKIRIYLQSSNACVRKLSVTIIVYLQYFALCVQMLHLDLVYVSFLILSSRFDFFLHILVAAVVFNVILLCVCKPPQMFLE